MTAKAQNFCGFAVFSGGVEVMKTIFTI